MESRKRSLVPTANERQAEPCTQDARARASHSGSGETQCRARVDLIAASPADCCTVCSCVLVVPVTTIDCAATTVLYCTILYYTVLYCTILCCAVLCCAVFCRRGLDQQLTVLLPPLPTASPAGVVAVLLHNSYCSYPYLYPYPCALFGLICALFPSHASAGDVPL